MKKFSLVLIVLMVFGCLPVQQEALCAESGDRDIASIVFDKRVKTHNISKLIYNPLVAADSGENMPIIEYLEADVIENYKKYVNDTSEKYFTSFLKDKAESFEEFKGAVKDAVIVTAVKYPNGVNNVKKVMEQYAEYIGVTVSDAVLDDYSKISGGEFSSTTELASRFNSIKCERQKGSSGGSGGSGGGSGSGPAIGGITADADSVITAGKPKEIDMKFVDLNPVPWAYRAISTLYSKNIISGRTETEFYPEAPVSREEFAKLLVCLLGLENEPYNTVFADAPEGEWYTSYVNIAYSNGICSGTGEFGFDGYIEMRHLQKVMRYSYQRQFAESWNYKNEREKIVLAEVSVSVVLVERNVPYGEYEEFAAGEAAQKGSWYFGENMRLELFPYLINPEENFTHFPLGELESHAYEEYLRTRCVYKTDVKGDSVGGGCAMYDFTEIQCGFFKINLRAYKPSRILLAYAEQLDSEGRPSMKALN